MKRFHLHISAENLDAPIKFYSTPFAERPAVQLSDKYWVTDPTGIAWETCHTLSNTPFYGEDIGLKAEREECCGGRPSTTLMPVVWWIQSLKAKESRMWLWRGRVSAARHSRKDPANST